jgi:hypothetical protein
MVDLAEALRLLRPSNNWIIDGDTLIWEDDIALKPTEQEIKETTEELQKALPMRVLRRQRDEKLKECDVYGLSDYPFPTDTIRQSWLSYRQELRALPTNVSPQLDEDGELINVTWPDKPSS